MQSDWAVQGGNSGFQPSGVTFLGSGARGVFEAELQVLAALPVVDLDPAGEVQALALHGGDEGAERASASASRTPPQPELRPTQHPPAPRFSPCTPPPLWPTHRACLAHRVARSSIG